MARLVPPLLLLVALSWAQPAAADPVLFLRGLPTSYTPGSTFTFDVVLQDATDLNAFDVTLVLEADGGTAGPGGDVSFVEPPEDHSNLPSIARYVFGAVPLADQAYFTTINAVSASRTELNLAGALDSGELSTVADANDLIERVTVAVASTFSGILRLSIDTSAVFLVREDASDIPGTVAVTPGSDAPASLPEDLAVVPEPGSATLALVAVGLGLGVRAFVGRRRRPARTGA